MKKSPLLICLYVVAHLLIIDMIFFLLGANGIVAPPVVISYNFIWIIIALVILNHTYDGSRS